MPSKVALVGPEAGGRTGDVSEVDVEQKWRPRQNRVGRKCLGEGRSYLGIARIPTGTPSNDGIFLPDTNTTTRESIRSCAPENGKTTIPLNWLSRTHNAPSPTSVQTLTSTPMGLSWQAPYSSSLSVSTSVGSAWKVGRGRLSCLESQVKVGWRGGRMNLGVLPAIASDDSEAKEVLAIAYPDNVSLSSFPLFTLRYTKPLSYTPHTWQILQPPDSNSAGHGC
ncbi:hypothetical protein PM082_015238 [Marasmius tenuissimus]|nr:hypothetical protein PM082_015238 [Marasmius tenuissimus]